MEDGNNGGYANAWLIADTRNNEIANLELGLKHVTLQRTHDGYFVGSNFPANPELIRDEASDYPVADLSISGNARHVRWEQLMQENKGKIDVAAAQRFWRITTIRSCIRMLPASGRYAAISIFRRVGPALGSPRSGPRARCKTRPPTPR